MTLVRWIENRTTMCSMYRDGSLSTRESCRRDECISIYPYRRFSLRCCARYGPYAVADSKADIGSRALIVLRDNSTRASAKAAPI